MARFNIWGSFCVAQYSLLSKVRPRPLNHLRVILQSGRRNWGRNPEITLQSVRKFSFLCSLDGSVRLTLSFWTISVSLAKNDTDPLGHDRGGEIQQTWSRFASLRSLQRTPKYKISYLTDNSAWVQGEDVFRRVWVHHVVDMPLESLPIDLVVVPPDDRVLVDQRANFAPQRFNGPSWDPSGRIGCRTAKSDGKRPGTGWCIFFPLGSVEEFHFDW